MAKTQYIDGEYYTSEAATAHWGTNATTGHTHDGSDVDGSVPKIPIAYDTTGSLQLTRVANLSAVFNGQIYGLDTTNGASDYYDITINPGSASNSGSTMTVLQTAITKQLDATWAAGTNAGGNSDSTMFIDTCYHVHLLGKSTDILAADAGFDKSPDATTLMANAAVIAAGYNTYRRIASVNFHGYDGDLIWPYYQRGDDFIFLGAHGSVSDSTSVTTTSIGPYTLTRSPLGISCKVKTGLAITIGSGRLFYADWDGILESSIISTSVTTGEPRVELWTNTASQIRIKCDTPTALVNGTVLGWTDLRGK